MKLYEIKNARYATKYVVAPDMSTALEKYRKYLDNVEDLPSYPGSTGLEGLWTSFELFGEITSCTYIRDYEDDIIR